MGRGVRGTWRPLPGRSGEGGERVGRPLVFTVLMPSRGEGGAGRVWGGGAR